MLNITYEHECDICHDHILTEHYQINPALNSAPIPMPTAPYRIGEIQLCHKCLCMAMEPLRSKQ